MATSVGPRINTVEDYEPYVGAGTVERIIKKAKNIQDLHIVHVNSTYYGGGVAELLSSFVLLLNSLGISSGWRVIQGTPDFFNITKRMHNALQGGAINLSRRKKQIYESVIHENSIRNHLDHDIVVIHDPQPLPIIRHYKKKGPWIWRCHIDLTSPNKELWDYLAEFVELYDAVVFSLEDYRRKLKTPQVFFPPAINPFRTTNRELSDEDIENRLKYYKIPTDLPLIVQVSRFDKWKDPEGVIRAFNLARKEVDCTLVLLGNVATDDPEGPQVYESLLKCREERIIIISCQDSALVNALQRRASVVLQKSLREGFGLTVAEAMWKGTPVIGGNVGGIRHQISDGENGYLVSTVDEAAQRIVQLLKDKKLCQRLGGNARKTVKKKFLLTQYVENYLDLFNSFETTYQFRGNH
jgi:trehalose synthase